MRRTRAYTQRVQWLTAFLNLRIEGRHHEGAEEALGLFGRVHHVRQVDDVDDRVTGMRRVVEPVARLPVRCCGHEVADVFAVLISAAALCTRLVPIPDNRGAPASCSVNNKARFRALSEERETRLELATLSLGS